MTHQYEQGGMMISMIDPLGRDAMMVLSSPCGTADLEL